MASFEDHMKEMIEEVVEDMDLGIAGAVEDAIEDKDWDELVRSEVKSYMETEEFNRKLRLMVREIMS